EIQQPEIVAPQFVAPEIQQPEIIAPPLVEPEIQQPEIVAPQFVEPVIQQPEMIEPIVEQPSTVQVQLIETEIQQPEIVLPQFVEPEIQQPEIVAPPLVEPVVQQPEIVREAYQSWATPDIAEHIVRAPQTTAPAEDLATAVWQALASSHLPMEETPAPQPMVLVEHMPEDTPTEPLDAHPETTSEKVYQHTPRFSRRYPAKAGYTAANQRLFF
ncbi:hypothetical protein, partial [Alysiella filiformis]